MICGPVEGPFNWEVGVMGLLLTTIGVGGVLFGISIFNGARRGVDSRFPGAKVSARKALGAILIIAATVFSLLAGFGLVRSILCP